VLGLLVLTGVWGNLYVDYFQARLRVKQVFLPVVLVNVATIVAAAAFLMVDRRVIPGIAILPLSEAVSLSILARYFNRELGFAKGRVQLAASLQLLRRSLPVAGTLIIAILYTRLDVLILGSFVDVATVGYYGVALRMTEPFQLMMAALAISMYSHLSTTLATSRQNIRHLIVRYGLGTIAYGFASCMVLAVVAPIAIRSLLPKYGPAIPVLQVLAVAVIFRTLNACLTSVIHAYGRFAWVTAVATWNLFAIGLLLWILIPKLGAPGAALALLVGEMMNTLIQSIMVSGLVSSKRETLVLGASSST